MPLRSFRGTSPSVEEGAYVDPDSVLIGNVKVRSAATVWPLALIRADDDSVEVGEGSAVMDMAFIEAPKGRPVRIGRGCIVSHGSKLHGCTISDGAMVGVGAIVLDGAVLEENSVLAAGSVLPPGGRVPAMALAMGSPAKVVRKLTASDRGSVREGLEAVRSKAEQYSLDP